jgi:hypothetical protein
MLSVVVVKKNGRPVMPADGFFRCADELGIRQSREPDHLLYARQLRAVFEYWKDKKE